MRNHTITQCYRLLSSTLAIPFWPTTGWNPMMECESPNTPIVSKGTGAGWIGDVIDGNGTAAATFVDDRRQYRKKQQQ
jgi:hypothetical protein